MQTYIGCSDIDAPCVPLGHVVVVNVRLESNSSDALPTLLLDRVARG